jgi:hypothetical protein
MTTPANPALVAAAPYILTALTDIETCATTILTGDPAQIGLRADGAFKILLGQLELLLPPLAVSEISVVNQDITTGIDSLKTRLQGLVTPATGAAVKPGAA